MAEGTTMCDRKESGIRTAWKKPDQIGSYFVTEWKPLLAVTVSGLIYNIGLLAGPWFEGRLAPSPRGAPGSLSTRTPEEH